jgi:hypothetical protein
MRHGVGELQTDRISPWGCALSMFENKAAGDHTLNHATVKVTVKVALSMAAEPWCAPVGSWGPPLLPW